MSASAGTVVGASELDRVRAWADAARRGVVAEPLAALEAIRARANAAGPEKGALTSLKWLWLLYGLATHRATAFTDRVQGHYVSGGVGGWADHEERRVIALGVVAGSLVTLGAGRPEQQRPGFITEWFAPCHVWRGGVNVGGVGSWGRQKDGALVKPLRGRLKKWAETTAEDRVSMDWNTARAVALALFAAPFDALPGCGES